MNRDPVTSAEAAAAIRDTPIRQASAHGHPEPSSRFERRCNTCGASFLGLAVGRTAERGLWVADWTWVCSVECDPRPAPQGDPT